LPVTRVPKLNGFCRCRQAAECRVGLQHRLVGRTEPGQLVEVVHHEHRIEAGCLGLLRLRDHSGKKLADSGAVAEVGDLKSEFYRHAFT
jgi:hypothetical protein